MTNRGSKICINPLSAKVLTGIKNEQAKITVSTQLVSVYQFIVLAGMFLALFFDCKIPARVNCE